MNNVKNYLFIISVSLLVGFGVSYAFTDSPEIRIEKENKKAIRECLSSIDYESTPDKIQSSAKSCSQLELKRIVDPNKLNNAKATTGSVIPEAPKWYTNKHSLILTWSNSYVKYSSRKWASWKNNNPSWLTWWVSNTLKGLWNNAWIRYSVGSLRPANEKGNYIYFETVEEWLRAKIIAIRERWWKATVSQYLGGWWTDDVKLSFDKSKIIKELSDWEFTELFIQQMKKESPGYVSQLVEDKILIIN